MIECRKIKIELDKGRSKLNGLGGKRCQTKSGRCLRVGSKCTRNRIPKISASSSPVSLLLQLVYGVNQLIDLVDYKMNFELIICLFGCNLKKCMNNLIDYLKMNLNFQKLKPIFFLFCTFLMKDRNYISHYIEGLLNGRPIRVFFASMI